MTDSRPPSPQTAADGPFDPFALEEQKAHNSTGSPAPAGRRRLRIPPPLLGLLLALAVAVPTIVATLQPAGQSSSDGGASPSVGEPATPPDPAPPSTGDGEQAAPPPTRGDDPDGAPLPEESPGTDQGSLQALAVEDCAASLPGLRGDCEITLGGDLSAAIRYMDCRRLGLPADECLVAPPRDDLVAPPREDPVAPPREDPVAPPREDPVAPPREDPVAPPREDP
jgi:hypothetical protein